MRYLAGARLEEVGDQNIQLEVIRCNTDLASLVRARRDINEVWQDERI